MANENLIRRLENYLAENFIEPEPPPEGAIVLHRAKFSIGHYEEKPPDKYDGFVGAMRVGNLIKFLTAWNWTELSGNAFLT